MGKRTQIWQIDIKNEAQELVCVSRITMMILDR
jgi:acyl-coenzyme A thioesterase PaaI-like protein